MNWTLINSVRYIEEDPFTAQEAYLVSLRNIDTVALVKKSTGAILWKSPKPLFSKQHDATLLPNGNILVFDNNAYPIRLPERPFDLLGSKVVEINPRTNEVVWEFSGGKTGVGKASFKAELVSGAQRLKNGNTLITHGPQGYLFEVTPENEIVWDMINPFSNKSDGPWPSKFIFKARRYTAEEINWPEELNPSLPLESSK